ncbi:MAG TPA: enoyl-CoA hydratase/isomerase family protein [Chloroflexota bacterium]|nr:enoyl-CoA hydratase/isomerase family protein [Chloroflexota bacterium]
MAELVLREDRDGLAILTLNRPERRNAMTPELMSALASAFREPAERAFVFTGAGSAFCVGADLKWLGALDDPGDGVATLVAAHHEVVRAMRQAVVPVVTAVNGPAAGGGMSLALAGDYCVAAPSATFTAAYFRLGLTPDGGNSAFLPALVGRARAMELLLTNRTLSADDALSWGLVNEAGSLDRACEVAAGFAPVPAETLLTSRRLLDGELLAQLDQEQKAVATAARRPGFAEAVRAFLRR